MNEALPLGCSKVSDCEDGNPCTQNLCAVGLCLPALPVLGCCFNGNCFDDGTGGEGGADAGTGGAGPVPSLDCSTDAQCDDSNPCTQNLCALGLCAALPVLGCCYQGVCEPGGEGGEGGGPPVTGGCSTNEQCEDGSNCTQNLCVAGLCTTLPVLLDPNCDGDDEPPVLGCSTNEQCEDGNGCTQNLCLIGVCAALPVLGGICTGGEGGAGGGGAGGEGGTGAVGGEGGTGGTIAQAGSSNVGGDGGAQPSGGTNSQAGTSAGGTSAAGTSAGGSETADGGNTDTAAGAPSNEDPNEPVVWQMQGGGCSVTAAGDRSPFSLALLVLGIAAVVQRRRRRFALALAAAAPFSVSGVARAAGFAQDGYTAPASPEDLMWTERAGGDTGHVRPFGRLTLGYADDPLVLVDANDSSREIRVVDDQFSAYAAFGFGFFHRAHLALTLPVYAQRAENQSPVNGVAGATIGDFGVDGRFAILRRTDPVELALAVTVRLPTGEQAAFASDGSVSVWPRALVSKQLTSNGTLLNLSVGPVLRPTDRSSDGALEMGSQLRASAGFLLAFTKALGATAELSSATAVSDPFARRTTPVEGAVGARLTLPSFTLGSSLSTGLTEGVGSPDVRWLVSLAAPGSAYEPKAAPPPPPPPPPPVDDDPDRDGVRGAADACPDQPEDRDGFEDADGCPETDNDKDGILDLADQCPAEAEDKDGFQDADGCPELDNDGDGVADATDKCPNEAETKNGVDDEDGCPDLIRIEQGQIRTLEPIYFDYNKATIQARSQPLLAEMAGLISSRPDLGVIAIEGHTDSKGSARYNLKLSKDRAAAVRASLVQAGVPEDRITSDGFGSERPIEDNKTEPGRAKNRRVEFRFTPPAASP